MPVSHRAERDNGLTGSATCSKPSGVISGDFMVACVGYYANISITAPSGWTLQATSFDGNSGSKIYTKTAGASEPSSYTWGVGGNYVDIGIDAFFGSTTLQIDGTVHQQQNVNGNGSCASLTATNSGEMLYNSIITDQNNLTNSNWTVNNSATLSWDADADGAGSAYKALASAGSSGATTFSTPTANNITTSLLITESSSGSTIPISATGIGADVGGLLGTAGALRQLQTLALGTTQGGLLSSRIGPLRPILLVGVGNENGGLVASVNNIVYLSAALGALSGGIDARAQALRALAAALGTTTGGIPAHAGSVPHVSSFSIGTENGGINAQAQVNTSGVIPPTAIGKLTAGLMISAAALKQAPPCQLGHIESGLSCVAQKAGTRPYWLRGPKTLVELDGGDIF